MAEIQPVPFAEVQHLAAAAAKDRVSISETQGTQWFVMREDGKIIATGALLRRNAIARLKGIWVEPGHRHRGVGESVTLQLIAHAVDVWLCGRIEALAHNPSFYYARGFTQASKARLNGAVMVGKNY